MFDASRIAFSSAEMTLMMSVTSLRWSNQVGSVSLRLRSQGTLSGSSSERSKTRVEVMMPERR